MAPRKVERAEAVAACPPEPGVDAVTHDPSGPQHAPKLGERRVELDEMFDRAVAAHDVEALISIVESADIGRLEPDPGGVSTCKVIQHGAPLQRPREAVDVQIDAYHLPCAETGKREREVTG